jgi:bacterial/archaeal transporter family-2 protein
MQFALYLLAAVLLGILVSFQPLLNGVLGRAIGSPYSAAAISIFVAAMGALVMLFFVDRGEISHANLTAVPWWIYMAGLIGTVFVAGSVVIAPVTGALVLFLCIVAGQLIGAALADHFGILGLALRPISPARLAGLALVVGGVVLVQRG